MANADPAALDEALDALGRGGVVVYPTETLYGLGADATSEAAVRRVADLQGRDTAKPILVLVATREMLTGVCSSVPEVAETLIRRFWPGPLTLVLPASARLSSLLTGGSGGIGVRISSHPLAHMLVERFGRPLTSTSANPGGRSPAADVTEARRYFAEGVDAYLDGGPAAGGSPSTVLDLCGRDPRLVREGAVSLEALAAVGLRFSAKSE